MWKDESLVGKRVFVSAGASGIGLEIANAFVEAGARVAVCDISKDALAAFSELHRQRIADRQAIAVQADVANEAEVNALFARIRAELGGLDVLVNNAGIAGPTGRVDTLQLADWERTLSVNITSQFLCVRAALPMLLEARDPAIVNLSSAAGHLGMPGRSVYSASKWAVIGFTKSLALELGEAGIRVNAVLPGAVDGPRIRAVIDAKAKAMNKSVEDVTRDYTGQAALGRMVSARDIANMVRFACSDQARNVHGQELVVDGLTQALS